MEQVTGTTDNGASIAFDLQTAYSNMGSPGTLKHVAAIRPTFRGQEDVSLGWAAQYDYRTAAVSPSQATFGPSTDVWESVDVDWEDWDEHNWEGNVTTPYHEWRAASGAGYALGCRIAGSADESVSLESIAYRISAGDGIL